MDPETGEPKKAPPQAPAAKPGEKTGPGNKPAKPSKAEGRTDFLVGDKTLAADLAKSVAGKTMRAESAKAVLASMVGVSDQEAGAMIDPAVKHVNPKAEPAPPAE